MFYFAVLAVLTELYKVILRYHNIVKLGSSMNN